MWLIAFESAAVDADSCEQKRFAAMWATPGFKHPARDIPKTLVPEDDFYALGIVLVCALTAVSYFSHDPSALPRFLDEFVRHGILPEVRHVIAALVDGDVIAACDTLSDWQPE